jgi:hypothetical protein
LNQGGRSAPESFEGNLIQKLKSAQEDIVQVPFEKKQYSLRLKIKAAI